MPELPSNSESQPDDQDDLDDLICDIQRSADSKIPSASGYTKTGSARLETSWGVAKTGVLMFNGLSIEDEDPFYPPPGGEEEKVDMCLAHPQA